MVLDYKVLRWVNFFSYFVVFLRFFFKVSVSGDEVTFVVGIFFCFRVVLYRGGGVIVFEYLGGVVV